MIFRTIGIIIFLAIVFFVLIPFGLYFAGVNIFSGNNTDIPPSTPQKTNTSQTLGVLIQSRDGGAHWENAAVSEHPNIPFPGTIYSFVTHPKDSNVIYLGGLASGLWKSVNGGRTWNRVADENHTLDPNADVYDIIIASANPDILYVAAYGKNHGRVLKSEDGGAHFTETYVTSAEKTGVFNVIVDVANKKHVLAATGEGTLIETVNGGQTWRVKKLFSRPLVRLIANPRDTQELYMINADGDIVKSVTGGNDWSDAIGKSSQSNGGIESLTIFDFFGGGAGKGLQPIFVLDPSHTSRIYSGREKSLLRSEDAGLTWKEITLLFSKDVLPVTAVAVDPRNSATIFVAAANELHTSTDDGVSWRNVPLPVGIRITNLIIHPKDSNIMFAVVSGQ